MDRDLAAKTVFMSNTTISQPKFLIEKIKPEVLKAIIDDQEDYPNITKTLLNELEKHWLCGYITYSSALTLMGYYKDAFGKYPKHAWDCFIEN